MLKKNYVKDQYLLDLIANTKINIDTCYKSNELELLFNIGYRFGNDLALYKIHYPTRGKEASAAEWVVRFYMALKK